MSLITITGPTGSGKTSLARALEEQGIKELVSTTTRPPRIGENDGDHYFFLSPQEFKNTPLVESIKYGENFYGLSADEVDRSRTQDCCVVLEPNGLEQAKAYCRDHKIPVLSIYISAPKELLVRRLLDRSAEDTPARILAALEEHSRWSELELYDRAYPGNSSLIYQRRVVDEILAWREEEGRGDEQD